MILAAIMIASFLLATAVINKKFRPYALLGLLVLLAVIGAAVHLTSDGKDRCLDSGGAWSEEGKACVLR